jgi:hypothetical protein
VDPVTVGPVSEDDAHRSNNDDGAIAVKPRAFGAPLCGIEV